MNRSSRPSGSEFQGELLTSAARGMGAVDQKRGAPEKLCASSGFTCSRHVLSNSGFLARFPDVVQRSYFFLIHKGSLRPT